MFSPEKMIQKELENVSSSTDAEASDGDVSKCFQQQEKADRAKVQKMIDVQKTT